MKLRLYEDVKRLMRGTSSAATDSFGRPLLDRAAPSLSLIFGAISWRARLLFGMEKLEIANPP